MDTLTLPVSEIFGPVWQGEGPHTGKIASFVRLGGCNLTCEWCDTPFTWDTSRYDLEFADLTADQVEAKLHTKIVILSGGEPMLHQRRQSFVELLGSDHEWHVETNGTISPTRAVVERVTHWTVSPKINTRDPLKKRLRIRPLIDFADLAEAGRAAFKFVAVTTEDVTYAAELCGDIGVIPSAVWIMPEGVTPDSILVGSRELADTVLSYGFNLTLRQQVLMYGSERAR